MAARVRRISAELFAARGFDATGVQELSDAIGLGRGALYYHIKSKQALLFSITMEHLEAALARAQEIAAMDADVEARLGLLTDALFRDLAENRAAWTVSLRDWLALEPADRAVVIARRDAYELIWQNLFDEGEAAGRLRSVSPLLRRGILGLFNSSHLWLDAHGRLTPEQVGAQYLELVLSGITLPAPAADARGAKLSAASSRRRPRA